ncbi:MAG: hypothetical protein WC916_01580 [Candidatus Woesearchaeota archaeon]
MKTRLILMSVLCVLLLVFTINYAWAAVGPDICTVEPDLPQCTQSNKYCGDSTVDSPNTLGVYEQCDWNSTNLTINITQCITFNSLWSGPAACLLNCSLDISKCGIPYDGTCNDTRVQYPNNQSIYEQCDNGPQNNDTAPSCAYSKTCNYCNTTCQTKIVKGEFCGDKICQASDETATSCKEDCGVSAISGWSTTVQGWEKSKGMLNAMKSGISINSTPFTLNASKKYTLSLYASSDVNISLARRSSGDTVFNLKTANSSTHKKTNITVSNSDEYVLIFYANSANILIDNVSLYEQSIIAFDSPPSITNDFGCCYDSYCWNGNTCVNSLNWTNNSRKDPLWNNVFTGVSWYSNHVNYSAYDWARGYRCITNESLYANWTISNIKYDWDFNESGYCSKPTDCFVAKDFDYNSSDVVSGCIPDGSFVKDKSNQPLSTGGNHYCYLGNWTSRTHIMALQLLNITQKTYADKPFRLFCDDSSNAFINGTSPNILIISSCALLIREASGERVILGVITDKVDDYDGDKGVAGLIRDKYVQNYYNNNPFSSCTQGTGAYLKCIEQSAPTATKAGLYLYYNNESKFYLLSNEQITGLSSRGFFASIWDAISKFFMRLFGVNTNTYPSNVSLSQIGNYDRIYFLQNGTIKVSALQEYKYDELDAKGHTFIYLNYTGTNNTNNYLDPEILAGKNYTFTSMSNTQEFILKDSADLWKYLTAVLRE